MKRYSPFLVLALLLVTGIRAYATSVVASGAAPAGGLDTAAIDLTGGFAYFGSTVPFFTLTPSPYLYSTGGQYSLANPASPTAFNTPGVFIHAAMAVDTSGTVYAADASGNIEKLPKSLATYSSSTISGVIAGIGTGVIDNTTSYWYLGSLDVPAVVYKVRTTDLVVVSSITLGAGEGPLVSSVIDSAGGFAYFGSSTTPGAVSKINLATFSEASPPATFTAGGEGPAQAMAIDLIGRMIYVGTADAPAKVVRVSLSPFQEVLPSLAFLAGENSIGSAIVDSTLGDAYFGTNTSPAKIIEVSLSAFNRGDVLPLAFGENNLSSAVIDPANHYGYFGTLTSPASVIQVDLFPALPLIVTQPQSQTVSIGQPASFSVVAVARTLAYQWLRDGAPIIGATASSYSFTPTFDDSGHSFSCNVSNSSGTTPSSGATLVVKPVIDVYPNPWRSDQGWPAKINFINLVPGSTIKIFTLSGHWVKTIHAPGSQASWDLTNDAGERVATDYYFYLITTGEKSQLVKGKLAVLH